MKIKKKVIKGAKKGVKLAKKVWKSHPMEEARKKGAEALIMGTSTLLLKKIGSKNK